MDKNVETIFSLKETFLRDLISSILMGFIFQRSSVIYYHPCFLSKDMCIQRKLFQTKRKTYLNTERWSCDLSEKLWWSPSFSSLPVFCPVSLSESALVTVQWLWQLPWQSSPGSGAGAALYWPITSPSRCSEPSHWLPVSHTGGKQSIESIWLPWSRLVQVDTSEPSRKIPGMWRNRNALRLNMFVILDVHTFMCY